jgi:hypothetical protein
MRGEFDTDGVVQLFWGKLPPLLEARNDEDMESFLQAGYVAAAESKSKRSSKK